VDTEIQIWNRGENRAEVEKVYGAEWVRRLYQTAAGSFLADRVLSGHWLSRLYGKLESSPLSRSKIEPFIRDFSINMDEYEEGPFPSFNDFFIRRFKPGKRPFIADPQRMAAPAEARYLAFDKIDLDQTFPIKGLELSPELLLGGESKARPFVGGALMIARLCPTDYHRFHFPDSGKVVEHYRIPGGLHSVNPLALRYKGDILVTNERHVTLLETENFGLLAYIEVGALCVGKIVQSHSLQGAFRRGDEKGYFLFGGSTVIVVGQPGVWSPDPDLLQHTKKGQEVFVKLGDGLARRCS
jgi:phosphatidylserine decarboxylase